MQFAECINFEYCKHKNFTRKKYIAKSGRNDSMERRINASSLFDRAISGANFSFYIRAPTRDIFSMDRVSLAVLYIYV